MYLPCVSPATRTTPTKKKAAMGEDDFKKVTPVVDVVVDVVVVVVVVVVAIWGSSSPR